MAESCGKSPLTCGNAVTYRRVFLGLQQVDTRGNRWIFLRDLRDSGGMEKEEHGRRLKTAMASKRYGREVIADATGRDVRTVTNWTAGRTMPSDAERIVLRRLLGDYDDPGDPVEIAIRGSRLTEDRQYGVLAYYKRELREQDEADERRRGA